MISKVGYDLVNVQVPLHLVDPSLASRIEWVYGNLWVVTGPLIIRSTIINVADSLRVKLPFEDEEFDYIRLNGVAFAVPENKVCRICTSA